MMRSHPRREILLSLHPGSARSAEPSGSAVQWMQEFTLPAQLAAWRKADYKMHRNSAQPEVAGGRGRRVACKDPEEAQRMKGGKPLMLAQEPLDEKVFLPLIVKRENPSFTLFFLWLIMYFSPHPFAPSLCFTFLISFLLIGYHFLKF